MSEAQKVPVGLEVGEYQITGLLGEGVRGTVCAGAQPVIGKKVAISHQPIVGASEEVFAVFQADPEGDDPR